MKIGDTVRDRISGIEGEIVAHIYGSDRQEQFCILRSGTDNAGQKWPEYWLAPDLLISADPF